MLLLWEAGGTSASVALTPVVLSLVPPPPAVTGAAAVSPAPKVLALGPVVPAVTGPAAVVPTPIVLALTPVVPAVAAGTVVALSPVAVVLTPVVPVGTTFNLIKAIGWELNSFTEYDGSGAAGSISTTHARSGARAWDLAGSVAKVANVPLGSGISDAWVWSHIAIYLEASPSAIHSVTALIDAANTVNRGRLRVATDRSIELWGATTKIGSSSAVLDLDRYYVLTLGVKHNTATGQLEIEGLLDGVPFASTSSWTESVGSVGHATAGALTSGVTVDFWLDDWILASGANGGQRPTPGMRVVLLRPNGAGDSAGWARGGTDSGANWSQVDETGTPNDATDYVQSSTLNAEDLYAMSDVALGSSDEVHAVTTEGRTTTDSLTGTPTFRFEIEKTASGTKLQSADITPASLSWLSNNASTVGLPPIVARNDPDGSAWTPTTVNSMQAGVKITADPGAAFIRLTNLWANVVYTPHPTVVSLSPVAVVVSPVAATATGAAGVVPTPNVLALGPVGPAVTGAAAVALTPKVLALGPVTPTVTGAAAVALSPRVLSLTPVVPAFSASIAVSLSPVSFALGPVAPAATGAANAVPAPHVLALTPVVPGVTGVAAVAPTPVVVVLTPVVPSYSANMVATPTPVVLSLSPVAPVITYAISVVPGPLVLALTLVTPRVDSGMLVTPTPVVLSLTSVTPVVGISIAVALSPVTLAAVPVDPVVTGGVATTPAPVIVMLTAVTPNAGAGVQVIPTPVGLLLVGPDAVATGAANSTVAPVVLLLTPQPVISGAGAVLLANPLAGRGDLIARLTVIGAGMPIEVEIYDASFNPPRLIALLEGARDPSWLDPLNEIGSGSFRIPRYDPKAGERIVARGNLVKMRLHGAPQFPWWIEQVARTVASPQGESGEWLAVSGPGGEALMDRARIDPPDRSLYGYIAVVLKDLIAEASTATRPVLSQMSANWSSSQDTAALPWNDAATWAFPWGSTSVIDVWRAAVGMGIEFRMTHALVLEAYEEGLGSHLESSVILRPGKHLRDALQLSEQEGRWINRAKVKGSAGTIVTAFGDHSDPRRGIREGFVDFGATDEPAALIRAGEAAIAATEGLAQAFRVPVHHGTGPGEFEPYLDYRKGDWVALDVPGVFNRLPFRVAAVSVSSTPGGGYQVDLDANAVRLDNMVRLKKLIESNASRLISVAGL